MTKARNLSLENLTMEELIARKRDIKREIDLRIKRQHSFLAAPGNISQPSAEDKQKVAKLLAYIDKADYDNIEKMWKQKPELMFIELYDKDGKLTSPLKRAFYNIDTWTWKPFYEWIRQNQPDLELKFLQQNDEQKKHVDLNYLQPLFDQYAVYDTQVQKWDRGEISGDEMVGEWRKLCEIQRERLPFHMIREMCREGKGVWSTESKFDAKTAPIGGRVYDYSVVSDINLDSDQFLFRFGSIIGLSRGVTRSAVCWGDLGGGPGCTSVSSFDGDSIRQLCKVRTSDLASIPTLAQTEEKIATLRK